MLPTLACVSALTQRIVKETPACLGCIFGMLGNLSTLCLGANGLVRCAIVLDATSDGKERKAKEQKVTSYY